MPVPARAVGGCEGVSAAVRKENLADLRTCGHHLALSAVRLGKATVGLWLLASRDPGSWPQRTLVLSFYTHGSRDLGSSDIPLVCGTLGWRIAIARTEGRPQDAPKKWGHPVLDTPAAHIDGW